MAMDDEGDNDVPVPIDDDGSTVHVRTPVDEVPSKYMWPKLIVETSWTSTLTMEVMYRTWLPRMVMFALKPLSVKGVALTLYKLMRGVTLPRVTEVEMLSTPQLMQKLPWPMVSSQLRAVVELFICEHKLLGEEVLSKTSLVGEWMWTILT